MKGFSLEKVFPIKLGKQLFFVGSYLFEKIGHEKDK